MLKFMVTFRFVTEFRHVMVFVYSLLSDLMEKREWSRGEYFALFRFRTVLTILPPILFAMSADEVDAITTILADQLLIYPDEDVLEALHDALTYLRVRRLRCVVWRVFDIDAFAPLTFISLVTNYVTVMIQFMKPQIEE